MLNELVTPGNDGLYIPAHQFQHLGNRRIQGDIVKVPLQPVIFRNLLHGFQGPEPDTGDGASFHDILRHGFHVPKIAVGITPGTAVVAGISRIVAQLPAVIDDHIGGVGTVLGALHHPAGVDGNLLEGIVAVVAVPVVAAENGTVNGSGIVAHHVAEGCAGRMYISLQLCGDQGAGFQLPAGQFHRIGAAAQIHGQGNFHAVIEPVAQGIGQGLDTKAVGHAAVPGKEIPGHLPGRIRSLPLHVRIGPLPGISQNQGIFRGIAVKSQPDFVHRGPLGMDRHRAVLPTGDSHIVIPPTVFFPTHIHQLIAQQQLYAFYLHIVSPFISESKRSRCSLLHRHSSAGQYPPSCR